MCSFFGSGEKIEAKIEEFVKKFEDRFADIEDKVYDQNISVKNKSFFQQDNDYEGNKEKFNALEDKIEELNEELSSQKKNYEQSIEELKQQIEYSNNQRKDLESTIQTLNMSMELILNEKEKFSKEQERSLNFESDIAELKQMAHQQSGLCPLIVLQP